MEIKEIESTPKLNLKRNLSFEISPFSQPTSNTPSLKMKSANLLPILSEKLPRNKRLFSYESTITRDSVISGYSDEDTKIGNSNNSDFRIDNIRLTDSSKKLVVLRVIILFVALIYFPFDSIASRGNNKIELKLIFNFLDNSNNFHIMNNALFYIVYIADLLTNVNAILIYSVITYIIFHPFRSIKNLVFISIGLYFIVLMRMFYSASRPFWYDIRENYLCPTSYSKPSITVFALVTFVGLTILSVFEEMKQNQGRDSITNYNRVTGLIIFVVSYFVIGIANVLTYEDFVYHISLAFIYSLLFIVLSLEFETSMHNFLLEALKSIEKTRKIKIQMLIITICLSVLSMMFYSITLNSTDSKFEEDVILISSCYDNSIFFGMKMTFLDSSLIFILPGAFFGAGFTVEKNLPKWWKKSIKTNIILSLCIIILGNGYFLLFRFLELYIENFELVFVIRCIKYFLFYQLFLGLFPLLITYCFNDKLSSKNVVEEDLLNKFDDDSIINSLKMKNSIFNDGVFVNEQVQIVPSSSIKKKRAKRIPSFKKTFENEITASIDKRKDGNLLFYNEIEEVSEKDSSDGNYPKSSIRKISLKNKIRSTMIERTTTNLTNLEDKNNIMNYEDDEYNQMRKNKFKSFASKDELIKKRSNS